MRGTTAVTVPVFHENIQQSQVFVTSNRILAQLNITLYQVKLINCHGLPSGPKEIYLRFQVCSK